MKEVSFPKESFVESGKFIQTVEISLIYIFLSPGLLDRQSLKSSLLPKVRQVCMTTGLLSVRVNSLICIGKLLEYMDKWQVIDDVLSWMPQIPSKVLQ